MTKADDIEVKVVEKKPDKPVDPVLQRALEKAHVTLMRHRLTAPFIGAMMLGTSEITEQGFPEGNATAGTDGINKKYHPDFLKTLTPAQLRGVVLHENLHVMKKDIHRHIDLFTENPQLANISCDFTVNDIIKQISEVDPQHVDLPPGGCWHIKFRNWTVREIYHFFKTGQDNQGNKEGKPKCNQHGGKIVIQIGGDKYTGDKFDEHEIGEALNMKPEEVKKLMDKINNAIHQGGLLAGRMGVEMPRSITDAAEPEVDWREVLREFVTTHTRGRDEYTYRKYNRHRVADDFYMPNTESEKVGGIIVAIDTSGSIGEKEISEFGAELVSICAIANPEWVKVLWWDTAVHSEQMFTEADYAAIMSLLKPTGGGGTHVGCVSQYVQKNKMDSDCVVVFTDGYVESDIIWHVQQPTLWMVTVNKDFSPPAGGKMVKYRSMTDD